MFNVRLAGGRLCGRWLFAWLWLLMSLVVSCFVLSFFPLDVLDEIWDWTESVPLDFPYLLLIWRFPRTGVIQQPYLKTVVTSSFTYFLFWITKQNKTGSIMGSCYSGDHNAEDHKHTDTIRCNIEEPQQKYCLGTVSNRLLGVSTLCFHSVCTQTQNNYNSFDSGANSVRKREIQKKCREARDYHLSNGALCWIIMLVRLMKVMFWWNAEIIFVGKYGYCKEISISDLVGGAKLMTVDFQQICGSFLRDRGFQCQHPVSVRKCRLLWCFPLSY